MRIAPQVLATIANVTTTSVPGVVAMGEVPGYPLLSRSRHDLTRGVKVTVRQNAVKLDLYVVVAQGINMVTTGAAIQHDVTKAVHDMLGMEVKDVNIFVQKIE